MIVHGSPAGSVLSSYVILYGAGRFCFEFLRGDPDRPYYYAFSEAQWISVILMTATICAELRHALPFNPWQFGITGLVLAAMIAVAVHRHLRLVPTHLLLNPRHVREIAETIDFARRVWIQDQASGNCRDLAEQVRVGTTSLGIKVSVDEVNSVHGCTHLYTLSNKDHSMSVDAAQTLSALICRLRHSGRSFDLIPGQQAVFHCVVSPRKDGVQRPRLAHNEVSFYGTTSL
jgi:hypothetical protein